MKSLDIESFSNFLAQKQIPVFLQTINSLSELKLLDQSIVSSDLSETILYDPLFTLQLIRHINQNPSKRRLTDITTAEHAIMMLGIEPFFNIFGNNAVIEEQPIEPVILHSLYKIARRCFVSGMLAKFIGQKQKDMQPEELQVAALLHDIAELLLTLYFPVQSRHISLLMQMHPNERSAVIQKKVLGFPLSDIEIALCSIWHLPPLTIELISSQHKENFPLQTQTEQRIKTVLVAVRYIRHSSKSWTDPAIFDDLTELSTILGKPLNEHFCQNIQEIVFNFAKQWDDKYQAFNVSLPPFGGNGPFFENNIIKNDENL